MSYVYIESENWTDEDGIKRHLYTVGFYKPDGRFEPESDHSEAGAAADRTAYLNGGLPWHIVEDIQGAIRRYMESQA